jgi:hypothetical protein
MVGVGWGGMVSNGDLEMDGGKERAGERKMTLRCDDENEIHVLLNTMETQMWREQFLNKWPTINGE